MIASSRYLLLRTGLKHVPVRNFFSQKQTNLLKQKPFACLLNRNAIVCFSTQTNTTDDSNSTNTSLRNLFFALVGALTISYYKTNKTYCDDLKVEEEEVKIDPGVYNNSLPTYTIDELKKHNKYSERKWVSYKNGVYDVTDFVEGHPGGEIILAAAGSDIEPFWKHYAVHHTNETYAILEELRIGNLKVDVSNKVDNDPYKSDPIRNPKLHVLTSKPFNAESPKEVSVDNIITSNELHFKRNHMAVPYVNLNEFELEIVDEINKKSYKFKIDDLKRKYKVYTVPVTIQCSGNKRKLMHEVEPVQGLMWEINAISTADWTGIKLFDLLNDLKIDTNDPRYKHVQFEGLDKGPTGAPYGASIPKEKAFDLNGDVLVAFQMNGVDIPLDRKQTL